MHTKFIRKGARFIDRTSGDIIEVTMFRKARPTWFVTFLIRGEEKAISYAEFQQRFELYDLSQEKNTRLAS